MRPLLMSIGDWFDRIDPGTHRRIKGLRLITAFGLAALLATVPQIARGHSSALGSLAAGFALWASVSEGKTTRYQSTCDLILPLCGRWHRRRQFCHSCTGFWDLTGRN